MAQDLSHRLRPGRGGGHLRARPREYGILARRLDGDAAGHVQAIHTVRVEQAGQAGAGKVGPGGAAGTASRPEGTSSGQPGAGAAPGSRLPAPMSRCRAASRPGRPSWCCWPWAFWGRSPGCLEQFGVDPTVAAISGRRRRLRHERAGRFRRRGRPARAEPGGVGDQRGARRRAPGPPVPDGPLPRPGRGSPAGALARARRCRAAQCCGRARPGLMAATEGAYAAARSGLYRMDRI